MLEYVNNFVRYKNVISDNLVQAKLDTKPLLSIMIPTYNRPEYLERAVKSAIDQKTGFEFEVCVIDNGTVSDGADQVLHLVQEIGSPVFHCTEIEPISGCSGTGIDVLSLPRLSGFQY